MSHGSSVSPEQDRPIGPAAGPPTNRSRGGHIVRIALVLIAIAFVVVLGYQARGYVSQFTLWLDGLGPWGPVAFIAGYIVATVAFVPGFLLTLAAGALFGLARGILFVFVAATLGASAAFLVARYVARGVIERKLAGNERFAAIDRAIGEQGRKIVFLLRLSPAFPFNLLNYGLGLTRVRFIDYLIASIGMLPGTILYVYYGKVVGDVAKLVAGANVERGAGNYVLWGIGLVATIVVTAFVTRLARRALREATGGRLEDHPASPPGAPGS
ncbi:MAG: TVP38/TMEM64 family protein [Acidobacteriota bacterium]